jgi:deoxycytidylate deaminase
MKNHLPKFFKPAAKVAEYSDHPVYKMGAVVYHKNKILGVGHNHATKTHPKMTLRGIHANIHAELSAIINVPNKSFLQHSHMVIYRENKMGGPAIARPCETCRALLRGFGIKKVVYTTNEGWASEWL